ncbi:MAG: cation:proton antiporter [Deltaproteobacteria bacterium]|nr:cation:proton antiporter [Deltaproteobacteria bacterium]
MTFLGWMAFASGLLMLMALVSSYVRDLPITTAALYLVVGIVIGPLGVGVVSLDLYANAALLERIAEVAVVIALFIGGLKLRLRPSDPAWRAAIVLAGPVMILTIAGIAAFAHLVFGLPVSAALLLGAVLAPTDPVLASAIAVTDAKDRDLMRYGISGEAGLNDGTAFPFVVLALAWAAHGGADTWIATWAAHRLVWAIPVALVLGYFLGKLIGKLAIRLRTNHRDATAPSDFLALALIGVAYVLAEAIGAWGFLSVFAAGVGLRAAEVAVVAETPHPEASQTTASDDGLEHPPAEELVAARVEPEALEQPAVAAGVLVSETLSFGDTVERLVEVGMIVAVGVALATHWDVRAIPLAAALFFVIRPLASTLLVFTPTTGPQRRLMAWFGIRGIGSLYYLGYSLRHGLDGALANEIIGLTISVIALSIVAHGITATPLLSRYQRARARREDQRSG